MLIQTLALAAMLAAGNDPLVFERQHLSKSTFEAASAFDVNNDGAVDVVSGAYWYQGPEMTVRHKIADIMPADEYWDDFADYPIDVNGDGFLDIVSGGFWGNALRWVENPKGQPVEWTVHIIGETGPIERACFEDLDGDGVVEAVATTGPIHIFRLVRDAQGKGTGKFEPFVIQQPGGGGHGLGIGEINGDGNPDLIFAGGWFEAPAEPFSGTWVWHPEFDVKVASHPMLAYDVNKDGLNDILFGQAHPYGLSWLEQKVDDHGKRTWTEHAIDPDRSQYHDLRLADIDNDGEPELITGKRYRAHNGHDPGADDPIGLYYFEINDGNFQRYTIDYGTPDKHAGAGIFFWVADVDANGWPDVVAPGKQGLYLFRNKGPLGQR